MYIYVYSDIYNIYKCIYKCICIYLFIYIYVCVHVFVCIHFYMYTYIYIYIHVCIYIHISHTHTDKHTHTHTHTGVEHKMSAEISAEFCPKVRLSPFCTWLQSILTLQVLFSRGGPFPDPNLSVRVHPRPSEGRSI